MAESHCGGGGFSSWSTLLRLVGSTTRRHPYDFRPLGSAVEDMSPFLALCSKEQAIVFRCLISSTLPAGPLRLSKLEAALQGCGCRSFWFSFPADCVWMTLPLSNTEGLLKQTKQARQYCHYPLECRDVTSKQRIWQSPIQMAVVGVTFFCRNTELAPVEDHLVHPLRVLEGNMKSQLTKGSENFNLQILKQNRNIYLNSNIIPN